MPNSAAVRNLLVLHCCITTAGRDHADGAQFCPYCNVIWLRYKPTGTRLHCYSDPSFRGTTEWEQTVCSAATHLLLDLTLRPGLLLADRFGCCCAKILCANRCGNFRPIRHAQLLPRTVCCAQCIHHIAQATHSWDGNSIHGHSLNLSEIWRAIQERGELGVLAAWAHGIVQQVQPRYREPQGEVKSNNCWAGTVAAGSHTLIHAAGQLVW